jgi:hypothetical protein
MEATVVNPPLNAMQIQFLQSLRFVQTEEMFNELKQIISDYHFKKLEEAADKWWDEDNMTNEKLDAMFSNSHFRTSYK